MKHKIIFRKGQHLIRGLFAVALILPMGVFDQNVFAQNGDWVAPAKANAYKNPYTGNEKATLEGKKLFAQLCAICHGNKGKGDGVAGMALKPRPSNFTKEVVQSHIPHSAVYQKFRIPIFIIYITSYILAL